MMIILGLICLMIAIVFGFNASDWLKDLPTAIVVTHWFITVVLGGVGIYGFVIGIKNIYKERTKEQTHG